VLVFTINFLLKGRSSIMERFWTIKTISILVPPNSLLKFAAAAAMQ
jgi:hypothetical protein